MESGIGELDISGYIKRRAIDELTWDQVCYGWNDEERQCAFVLTVDGGNRCPYESPSRGRQCVEDSNWDRTPPLPYSEGICKPFCDEVHAGSGVEERTALDRLLVVG